MNDDTLHAAAHIPLLVRDLRIILATTRRGLAQVPDPHGQALIRARAQELLGELEQRVLLDGSDAALLSDIRIARQEMIR